MEVYQTDDQGFFLFPVAADRNPLEKDNWLIPRGCVTEKPPVLKEGQKAKWEGGKWAVVDPEPQPEPEVVDKAKDIRAERNYLLTKSDWTQVADAPVDQGAWAAYRQELRDVPAQEGFPDNVIWPESP